MSFRSITERIEKTNKTENINDYMKQYRNIRKEHFKNLDKCKYYKKKGLSQELIDKYGELSADVFKLKTIFETIKNKKPEYIDLIIQEFLNN